MIVDIELKNEATFDQTGQRMEGLKKINFVFGSNGVGKTTISRVIADPEKHDDCIVSWEGENTLQALVYNRDFFDSNFNTDNKLKGIFTLGEEDEAVIQGIKTAKQELGEIETKLFSLRNNLEGQSDDTGKKAELDALTKASEEKCWRYKTKYEDDFKDGMRGVLNSKVEFSSRLRKEADNNTVELLSFEELKSKAETVFADGLETVQVFLLPDTVEIIGYEESAILQKRVIGKEDVDIAAMIQKLGNSDWVKDGIEFFKGNDGSCPFCQQEVNSEFEKSLANYFDEAFLQDLDEIGSIITNYSANADVILERLNLVVEGNHSFIDGEKLKSLCDALQVMIGANKQHLEKKKSEPSTKVSLVPLGDALKSIEECLTEANVKIETHNKIVENYNQEKIDTIAGIWRFLADEAKTDIDDFTSKAAALQKAIDGLTEQIVEQTVNRASKIGELQELEKKVTSVQPTIDSINSLLSSYGFNSFKLSKAESEGFYKIVRPSGDDASFSLSEGEQSFVAFLYFYNLVRGSTTESGVTTDRIVVFDDPVSSLDSDILYIVSSLIKSVIKEAADGGQVKQVFLMTHNIYFHKEVTYQRRGEGGGRSFWIVKKVNDVSKIENHETNPIKTSYELLWREVKDPNRSPITIRNTLRRILEYYFKIIGNMEFDELPEKFVGQDKLICKSLISWLHGGSHFTEDDLHVITGPEVVEKQLDIFRRIFEETSHGAHYDMMMGKTGNGNNDNDQSKPAA